MTVASAFTTLGQRLAQALERTGFVPTVHDLILDPSDALPPLGDETDFITWAALSRGETRSVRALIGAPSPRYVIEHRAVLDTAWAGPSQAHGRSLHRLALAEVAHLCVTDPTLSGSVERWFIEEGRDEPLTPNGWATSLVCAFRIRSSDPLGLTA